MTIATCAKSQVLECHHTPFYDAASLIGIVISSKLLSQPG